MSTWGSPLDWPLAFVAGAPSSGQSFLPSLIAEAVLALFCMWRL